MAEQALQRQEQASGAELSCDALLDLAQHVETRCGDGKMVWRVWGRGHPLVLLHGGSGSWRHWSRNIEFLAQNRMVVCADLPGLGDSDMPPEPCGPESVGGIVGHGLRCILPKGLACDLVGFSFGALIAGHTAVAAPECIRSLILVGAGALGVPRGPIRLERVRNKIGEERRVAHRTNLERLMLADPGQIDDLALEIQDQNTRRARLSSLPFATTASLAGALEQVRAPLGAIWGEKDAPAAPDLPGRIAALRRVRPDAAVRVIPGAGHWVAYEAPQAFHTALNDLMPCSDRP
ncbi:alpha/beta fold hydrolase [Teichococcus wenyumeiae]|nr:alpha/beta fold hydrolase [Pseudoroseomonas wenyumeiae]